MSGNDGEVTSIASLDEAVLRQKYTCIAAIALAVYEYVITIEQEVDTVWKRKLNWTSVFLLAIRYTTLLDAILQASLLLAGGEVSNCEAYVIVLGIISAILTLEIVGFCALRVYALSNQSILVAGLVFVYGGWIPFVFDLIISARSTSSFAPPPYNICVISVRITLAAYNAYIYVYYICIGLSELFVLLLTWRKTYRQIRLTRNMALGSFPSLAACFARNGSLYFVAGLVVIILGAAGGIANLPFINQITQITQLVPLMLASRFIMSLRRAGQATPSSQIESIALGSTIRFSHGDAGGTDSENAQYLDGAGSGEGSEPA